jgi:hypothetical protein
MEWSAVKLIFGLLVSIASQETVYHLRVVVHGCKVKWGLELVGKGVEVGSSFNQLVNRLDVTIISSMMKGSPSVRINNINIRVHRENGFKGILLVSLVLGTQNCLMNWGLASNRCSLIDFISTVNQIGQVFDICLRSSVVQ